MEQSRSPSVSPSKQPASAISTAVTLFEQYCNGGNPFEIQADSKDDETEDVLASNGVWSVSRNKNQIYLSLNGYLFHVSMMVNCSTLVFYQSLYYVNSKAAFLL